eukprot:1160640-Pelagomonas_calceolata.AAC.1
MASREQKEGEEEVGLAWWEVTNIASGRLDASQDLLGKIHGNRLNSYAGLMHLTGLALLASSSKG